MTINVRMKPRVPNPARRKAWNEHCRAMAVATTKQLEREVAAKRAKQ
jgi:hypothetical protein